jgi:hypothetical protein
VSGRQLALVLIQHCLQLRLLRRHRAHKLLLVRQQAVPLPLQGSQGSILLGSRGSQAVQLLLQPLLLLAELSPELLLLCTQGCCRLLTGRQLALCHRQLSLHGGQLGADGCGQRLAPCGSLRHLALEALNLLVQLCTGAGKAARRGIYEGGDYV